MAGMRLGYAVGHPETIRKLGSWEGANSLNVAGVVAATTSIRDTARIEKERARNTEARKYTVDWFTRAGFPPTDSQTNFLFVKIGRPAKEFREACRAQGVIVARDFPPFEKTHARVSVGTLEEMRRATEVFANVLGVKGDRRAA
jgi:histidinol-phosphate aminotransferase